ncbi:hypothetical protein AAWM_10325 [Aspergillus awamori]|uniref:Mid2 domain-containing protein n=2 Tax=Aspergillus TaxID=5052 RepID=A0A1D8DGP9_9EURO|nr:hypothetical protein [Aspergillus welwitschiae]AOS89744.1 hypothetical protein [Aspergillus welwitschiae]GCB27440.1 hypothetical protein AAWM_10325 [Aspergillus awamori]GKZ62100.1 hypothetical protein AnigIFM49718_009170 [Aspergillus niger]GLA08886.1 hypothetical protein AnigIFM60653_010685 [Aspergillus niger]
MWLYHLLLIALLERLVAGTTCYFPEGNVAEDYTPCSDNGVSFCCNKDSICLSNGLCTSMHQPYVLGRGACTSQSWNDTSVCDDVCHGITTAWSSACSLILYGTVNGVKLYCPNSIISNGTDSLGCANGVSPISVGTGKPIAGKAYLASYSLLPTASTATSTATATSTTEPDTSSPSTTTADESCSSSTAANSNQVSRATVTAVGAGVGVPLGLLALASLGYGFNERRKRLQLQNASPNMYQMPAASSTSYRSRNVGAKELSGHIPLHELDT